MQIPEEGTLLRVFLGEADRHGGRPLYEAIVLKARELHLAGATVVRGVMGFGRNSRLHTAKILRLSEDLPVVVEIVDSEPNIQRLLPWLDETVHEGLVTLERARVVRYVGEGPRGVRPQAAAGDAGGSAGGPEREA
jgi:PII-like signaling protein